ncbi:hypothetical protein SAMN04487911_1341 [Arenibacter nanhaiticus]|uniref:Uncharacterized protein n=1 Tax=Arenibacter nanhaiticus TaxID=558155 RepID=A0A1M6LTN3_9FLAO|nr:hypothetical protein [Arenibacter nanhaiticus]SHJ74571.1 hypothetical protein SAMN04487911_1341 [Arenibacter nanhaiticus]
MKTLKVFSVLFTITALIVLNAQDTNEAGHPMEINISEVALLDIYDNNTGSPAATIQFHLDNNSASEAGLYDMSNATYTGLWLNYTSLVANEEKSSASKGERNISVQMEKESTFPNGLDLVITSTQSSFVDILEHADPSKAQPIGNCRSGGC